MPIDNCTSSFSELATSVLPQYMEKLRGKLQQPHRLETFCISDKPGTTNRGQATENRKPKTENRRKPGQAQLYCQLGPSFGLALDTPATLKSEWPTLRAGRSRFLTR
jgi:hypothetical protein